MTRTPLINRLLPLGVACHECPPQPESPPLHPLEEMHVTDSRISAKRRQEFALGRWCARQALTPFGRGQEPLLTGASRAPIWPEGFTGSITHCQEYCAAAVARTSDLIAIGIDAESWREMPLDVAIHIAAGREYAVCGLEPSNARDLALIFSAKESIFKALYPLIGIFFDFLSTTIMVDSTSGSFSIESSMLPEIETYKPVLLGRFLIADNLILTSACINR